jgi:hypothetical protein
VPFPVPPPERGRPQLSHPRFEEAATTDRTPSPRPSPCIRPVWFSRQSQASRSWRLARRVIAVALPAAAAAVVLLVAVAPPAFADAASAATSLNTVIDNLRDWLVGILAAVATLFLTVGGLRYLTAGGDPGQVEKAKTALKSAAIGYALAALAPLLVSILASLF